MSSRQRGLGRGLLRRAVYPALEEVWGTGFFLAGLYQQWHWRMRHLAFGGGTRVGIVAPHPDDETGGCGGVAGLHHATGDHVSALIVTDGSASRAGGLAPAVMAQVRAAEAQAAAAVLGLDTLTLAGLPEGQWEQDTGRATIADWLAATRPAVLYAPSCIDYHPEHLQVARALAAALATQPLDPAPEVRVYEIFVPLGPALVNSIADLGPGRATKAAALACYTSQAAGLAQIARRDHYLARLYGLRRAAEGFCTLTVAQYSALIAAGDWTGRPSPYRSLRGRPLSDPLAYLMGSAERARLQQMLEPVGTV